MLPVPSRPRSHPNPAIGVTNPFAPDQEAVVTSVFVLRRSNTSALTQRWCSRIAPRGTPKTGEAWNAIAAECRRASVPFAGHTADCVSTTQAAAAGQRSIEHLDGVLLDASSRSTLFRQARRFTPDGAMLESFDPTRARQMYAAYVQYGTWHCPTLVVHRGLYPQPIQTKLREITVDMYRAGVRLLAGSDTGAFGIEPGPGLHTELELLVSGGIPPAAVLRIATLGAAEYLNRQLELGTIAPGKLADLVLLDANPLQSISATRTVRAVIANGVLYDRPALDRLVH